MLLKIAIALLFCTFVNHNVIAKELEEIIFEPTGLNLAILDEQVPQQNSEIKLEPVTIDENEVLEADIKKRSVFEVYLQQLRMDEVPTPLLKDVLTFEDKGIFEKSTFYGNYRGDFLFDFSQNDYHTNFSDSILEFGSYGKFKEIPLEYSLRVSPRHIKNHNLMQTLVTDAYLTFTGIENNKISVGQMRTPVGVEGAMSALSTPFLARSQISRTFGNYRAVGLKVDGKYPLVNYNLGVFSSDRYFSKYFSGMEFVGMVHFKPLGKTDGKYGDLSLSGGLQVGHKDYDYAVGTFGGAYKYKKFKVDFEYSGADGYNGALTNSKNRASGFYTSAYYNLTDKIQLLARYDMFNPNRGASSYQKEYTGGVNYFIRGDSLKLMLNYVFYENFDKNNGSRLYLGTQIML